MIWKILVTVLTLDFLYRICRYGKLEVQHFRNMFKKETVDRRSWAFPYDQQKTDYNQGSKDADGLAHIVEPSATVTSGKIEGQEALPSKKKKEK